MTPEMKAKIDAIIEKRLADPIYPAVRPNILKEFQARWKRNTRA